MLADESDDHEEEDEESVDKEGEGGAAGGDSDDNDDRSSAVCKEAAPSMSQDRAVYSAQQFLQEGASKRAPPFLQATSSRKVHRGNGTVPLSVPLEKRESAATGELVDTNYDEF